MRKLILLAVFAILTPTVLLLNIFLLSYIQFSKTNSQNSVFSSPKTHYYAAVPKDPSTLEQETDELDKRIEKVRSFLSRYNSPLKDYAGHIVEAADRYGLDYRLIPAIAMQESNLCKKAPAGSYNCWGFGIYGKTITKFENYNQAIEAVTKTLAKNYINQGLATPEEIASKYTPSDDGKWVKSVNHFMNLL